MTEQVLVLLRLRATIPSEADERALGICCYGGPLKPKSACASCAAWQPSAAFTPRATIVGQQIDPNQVQTVAERLRNTPGLPTASPSKRQVGCERKDGLLNIHPENETCEVCETKKGT